MTLKAFADQIGVSSPFVTQLTKGRRTPSARLAIKIEEVTSGAVPFRGWYPEQKEKVA